MATFLNTSGTTFYLEELIKGARKHLTLVSPYLKLKTRVRQLLVDANDSGIELDILYGKGELPLEEQEFLSTLDNADIRYCENLHAKCYLNEMVAIITSMNLYDFSQVNNNEMGILLRREEDAHCYDEALEETRRLWRISEEHKPRVAKKPSAAALASHEPSPLKSVAPTTPAEEIYEKLTTAKIAENCKVKTSELFEYFLAKGYLELKDGKHYLTEKGKSRGAEFRMGKTGPFFLWPKTMLKKFQK